MNPRTIMAVYAFLIGLAVVGTSNLAVISYADKPDEDDPPRNCFGQGASDFESGEMGEHSREGGARQEMRHSMMMTNQDVKA